MKFWDSSALLPLIVNEVASLRIVAVAAQDRNIAVWCLAEVEIESALARRSRDDLEPDELELARARVRALSERWQSVVSLESVRSRAIRLVRTHPLRAANALQLAAAITASGEQPEALDFVCLDDRLREAARKEGFPVLPA